MTVDAVVIFTDIRGFTRWANEPEVFAKLEIFAARFDDFIRHHFPPPIYVKTLGDGAMIVDEKTSADSRVRLHELLEVIDDAEADFALFCQRFSDEIGHPVPLKLGWSIVKGAVQRLPADYIGPNLNKAARLCDLARPHGIVIERDDFAHLPDASRRFYPQTRMLSGIEAVEVWVTEEIQNQFLPRERLRQQPEVHIAGVCFRQIKNRLEILLARRSPQRSLYPNLWAVPGGQLAPDETFAQGVQRHLRRELDVQVEVREEFHLFYQIREPNTPLIPGIRFLCQWQAGEPQTSQTVSAVRWVSESELKKMQAEEFVPGLQREIAQLLKQWKDFSRA